MDFRTAANTLFLMITLHFSWVSLISASASLKNLKLDWTIVDLEKHILTWDSTDPLLRVYSAWKRKSEEKFTWDQGAAVGQSCDSRTEEGDVTKCSMTIYTRLGSNLTLRLCRKGNIKKCRTFFVNDDDDPADDNLGFQDVMYSTQLTSMRMTRYTTAEDSITLYSVAYPESVCEYEHVWYSIVAIEYTGSDESETCVPTETKKEELKKEEFMEAGYEVCDSSGVKRNVSDLKPDTKYCIFMQYKVRHRGKTIHAAVYHRGPIQTESMEAIYQSLSNDESVVAFPKYWLIGFITLSVVLSLLTLAVGVLKYVKPIMKLDRKDRELVRSLLHALGGNVDEPCPKYQETITGEKSDKLDPVDDRKREFKRELDSKFVDAPSTDSLLESRKFGSADTLLAIPPDSQSPPSNGNQQNDTDLHVSISCDGSLYKSSSNISDDYIEKPTDDGEGKLNPPSYVTVKTELLTSDTAVLIPSVDLE